VNQNARARVTILAVVSGCVLLGACSTHEPASPEIKVLKAILLLHEAEGRYFAIHGRYGSLEELGPQGAQLISMELSGGKSEAYRVAVEAESRAYVITAIPLRPAAGSRRSFYSDGTRRIRHSWTSHPAGPESEELK
jgi:hypothetical protein